MSINDLLKKAAIVAIVIVIIALSVGAIYRKEASQGSPNANTVLDALAKEYPATPYWLVLLTDAPPTAPENALEAAHGHAWLAVMDTQAMTVTALGFYAKDSSSLSFSNPQTTGEFRDDSGRKFTVARAYEINNQAHAQWVAYLAAQKNATPTYNSVSYNCASWVVNSAQHVINVRDVAKYNFKIADPGAIIDQNEDINTYNPRDLAVFLKDSRYERSQVFVAGVNIK